MFNKLSTYFILMVLLCSYKGAMSAHLVGGELYYDCLGPDQQKVGYYSYLLHMRIYRDCNGNGSGFDDPAWMVRFNELNFPVDTFYMYLDSTKYISSYIDNPCLVTPPDICVQAGYYSALISIKAGEGDFVISNQRCCRNNTIVNIYNPGETGSTYTTIIKDPSLTACNSSPRFKDFPPLAICNNFPIEFDHSAIDPDGDSLVYELSTPLSGADVVNPRQYAQPPPYDPIDWVLTFSAANPLKASKRLQISASGFLDGTPGKLGQYVVGVGVSEYREGEKLSTTFRDFQFNVADCSPAVFSAIQEQQEVCAGLSYQMINISQGATKYKWDFGVEGSLADTSRSRSPTFTFPDTGVYKVMLIANPGWPCADTSVSIFDVRYKVIAHFQDPPIQCLNNNSVQFKAEGTFGSSAKFFWLFKDSTLRESTQRNPLVSFTEAGRFPVYLTIKENGCESTHRGSIELVKNPVSNFSFDVDSGCRPLQVNFTQISQHADKPKFTWDLGDGNILYGSNITHLYTQPGNYNVTLLVDNQGACKDTSFKKIHDAISVLPLPTSAFRVSKRLASKFESIIQFFDESIQATKVEYYPIPGIKLKQKDPLFKFPDTGYFNIMQISYNLFGCADTSFQLIYIYDEFHCYIPNAFTPNGDGNNEYFKPVISGVKKYHFQVYNRWGELLFQTHESTQGWDGTRNGQASQVGNYVYVVEAIDKIGNEKAYKGTFLLIR